ncbi:hypothetical protein HH214_21205 [Mucilaginibacter robiniae]|uniref:Pyridoxamine 5'-phosphate oxidase family protein n=1 Tax=Mucilaginibacter robiniae TaxID=2728022 RepID=A0A7L5E597_9SPHI|nr:pyridoxamine 5'-phosphate oxidase family protein [Mucilaginibacter robiniae]QJD98215.1 hypothetical protein HH214_21205 [Mucilaginibacter robiniae]
MLRTLNDTEIQEVLKSNFLARIGCTDGTKVYVVPIHYHYEENAVLCYSLEGLKIDLMRKHTSVCLEVDEIRDANHWRCVVINGRYEEITNENELGDLRPRYTEYLIRQRVSLPSESPNADQLESTDLHSNTAQVFFRIKYESISGRADD